MLYFNRSRIGYRVPSDTRMERCLVLHHLFAAMTVLSCAAVSSPECLTTLPHYPVFVPPASYSATSLDGGFWYGTDSLWTHLWVNSTWNLERNVGEGRFYRTKLQYWQKVRAYDRRTGAQPELIVTAKRLDSEAPLVSAELANVSFDNGTLAMMTAINIPTIGCWEITGRYKGQALSFVVSVEP